MDLVCKDLGLFHQLINKYKIPSEISPLMIKIFNEGIEENSFVRVVREDPKREGLLYAGTERGLYLSMDGGKAWKKWQHNLPIVPITDLKVHHNDLIVATQGRAFWIFDDLTPLHQFSSKLKENNVYFFDVVDKHKVLFS